MSKVSENKKLTKDELMKKIERMEENEKTFKRQMVEANEKFEDERKKREKLEDEYIYFFIF